MQGYLEWIAVGEEITKRAKKGYQPPTDHARVQFGHTETGRIIKKWRKKGEHVAKSQAFYWTVIIAVFLNTVVLATEHAGEPEWLDAFQGTYFFLCLTRQFSASDDQNFA